MKRAYFHPARVRLLVEEKLDFEVSDKEWRFIALMLDIEEKCHIEEEDLRYDLPRIKELLRLLGRNSR